MLYESIPEVARTILRPDEILALMNEKEGKGETPFLPAIDDIERAKAAIATTGYLGHVAPVLRNFGLPLKGHYGRYVKDVCRILDEIERGVTGKWAICIPTGTGKTSTLAVFVTHSSKSILVAVPNLNSMVEFVQLLKELKADLARVGCVFSDDAGNEDAREMLKELRTTTFSDKRVLLICHARLTNSRKDWEAMLYRDGKQRVVCYDESLIYGEVLPFKMALLKKEYTNLRDYLSPSALSWIEGCKEAIEKAIVGRVVHLPVPPLNVEADIAKALVAEKRSTGSRKTEVCEVIPTLTKCGVARKDEDGAFSYVHTLPDNIETLLVFDASHYHSRISKLDESIKVLAMEHVLKWHHDVTIKFDPSGKLGLWSNLEEPTVLRNKQFLARVPEDRVVICFKDAATSVCHPIRSRW